MRSNNREKDDSEGIPGKRGSKRKGKDTAWEHVEKLKRSGVTGA